MPLCTKALEALTRQCQVRLHTDSKYVQQGISEWVHNWKKRGWKTADKKPVKNEDLSKIGTGKVVLPASIGGVK